MENNLEGNFIGAIGQFVNFDKHRKDYTQHFDALRDQLYSHWRSNKALNKLANGFTLGGSYGDNVKVAMPNEFDLVIHLTFPENDKIMVKADPRRPGNVTLDMTRVMEIICNQEPNKPVFEQLQKMVNGKQMLLEDKLQSWLQGVMTQAVAKMGSQIEVGGVVSPIRYRRCGPAHTIEVKGRCEYSVDFVPAIRLSAAQNVLPAAQKTYFGRTPHWDAIPKPMKPAQPENISFRASYYEAEKQLLHDKKNLKNALRLLKQNRDTKNNVSNLKSYYIKTLFLWEVTRQNASYWQKPVSQIVIDMLDRISNSLNLTSGKGKLLFFWDPRLDMFAELKDNQRTNMFNCVCKTRYTFQRGFGNLTDDIRNNVQSSFGKSVKRGTKL
ncbi:hypothetical protein KR009_007761 [Drosophila setifemur]|nr:hypothetical protein KR009_007761 [Drosophila setifemur]